MRVESPPKRERLLKLRDEIKRVIDYRSFYLRYCPNAHLSGGRLQTLCPIPAHTHSGTGQPSLSIDLTRGLFHCFSRDEGGDAIRFYELMHEVKFSRAVHELARELGLAGWSQRERSLALRAAPDEAATEQEPLAQERVNAVCEAFLAACRAEDQAEGFNYLARRGIDGGTARRTGVVYFPRRAYRRVMRRMQEAFALEELQRSGLFNARAHLTFYRHRLLFPFRVEGRAIYLQARTTAAGVEPRWHNMRGGVPSLYNVDALHELASRSIVYLVEGFTDTLTLLAHNFAAVGLVGASGLKAEWLAPLGRFRVVAALDPDAAHPLAPSLIPLFHPCSFILYNHVSCFQRDAKVGVAFLMSEQIKDAVETEAAKLTVVDKLRLLLDITKKISRSLDVDEVLELVMDTLGSLLPYDAAGIYVIECAMNIDSDGKCEFPALKNFSTTAVRGYDIEELSGLHLKVGEGLLGSVAQTGEPLIVADVSLDPRYVNARRETCSEMVAPIISNDEVIGAFDLESDQKNAYTEDDLEILMLLASQVAIIIEKAMLHEQLIEKKRLQAQLEVARHVQLELLPARDPQLAGFDISAYNFSTEEVSGDYYDFVNLYEDHLGIVIADVSGKGVPAALLMAFLRASLRAAIHTGYAPNISMAKVNNLLWES
ncbi:MAG: GAF domain-containing protein, partial [Acidobacteria bacterium]|nr:GAF domain-containing protein [Acidobacteriota bacterium]